jgi:hypothetical protein
VERSAEIQVTGGDAATVTEVDLKAPPREVAALLPRVTHQVEEDLYGEVERAR